MMIRENRCCTIARHSSYNFIFLTDAQVYPSCSRMKMKMKMNNWKEKGKRTVRNSNFSVTFISRSICSRNSAKYKRGLVYRKNPSNDPYKISLSRMLFAQRISNRENSCDFMTSHYAPVSLKNGPQNGTSSSFLVPHINRCLRRDKQCSVFCPRHNAGSHTTHYTHDTSLSRNFARKTP